MEGSNTSYAHANCADPQATGPRGNSRSGCSTESMNTQRTLSVSVPLAPFSASRSESGVLAGGLHGLQLTKNGEAFRIRCFGVAPSSEKGDSSQETVLTKSHRSASRDRDRRDRDRERDSRDRGRDRERDVRDRGRERDKPQHSRSNSRGKGGVRKERYTSRDRDRRDRDREGDRGSWREDRYSRSHRRDDWNDDRRGSDRRNYEREMSNVNSYSRSRKRDSRREYDRDKGGRDRERSRSRGRDRR